MRKSELIQIWVSVTPAQKRALDQLSKVTHIPRSVLLREAVDDLLVKYNASRPSRQRQRSQM